MAYPSNPSANQIYVLFGYFSLFANSKCAWCGLLYWWSHDLSGYPQKDFLASLTLKKPKKTQKCKRIRKWAPKVRENSENFEKMVKVMDYVLKMLNFWPTFSLIFHGLFRLGSSSELLENFSGSQNVRLLREKHSPVVCEGNAENWTP